MMETELKIICTDFDGTLHSESQNPPIPEGLLSLIAQFQRRGAKWVVNTGRDLGSLQATLSRTSQGVHPDYLIVVEREIHTRTQRVYLAHDAWNHQCAREQETLFKLVRPRMGEVKSWIRARFHALVYEDVYSPFCLAATSNDDADEILDYVQSFFRDLPELTIVRNDIYARFSHVRYNKGTALGEVARLENAKPEQILAAGDHWNDIPMFTNRFARWMIAPSNSVADVKALVLSQNGFVATLPGGLGVLEGLAHFLNAKLLARPSEQGAEL
jgi:HAD superfamily hydrolase (TIGR01484 family)